MHIFVFPFWAPKQTACIFGISFLFFCFVWDNGDTIEGTHRGASKSLGTGIWDGGICTLHDWVQYTLTHAHTHTWGIGIWSFAFFFSLGFCLVVERELFGYPYFFVVVPQRYPFVVLASPRRLEGWMGVCFFCLFASVSWLGI